MAYKVGDIVKHMGVFGGRCYEYVIIKVNKSTLMVENDSVIRLIFKADVIK